MMDTALKKAIYEALVEYTAKYGEESLRKSPFSFEKIMERDFAEQMNSKKAA